MPLLMEDLKPEQAEQRWLSLCGKQEAEVLVNEGLAHCAGN